MDGLLPKKSPPKRRRPRMRAKRWLILAVLLAVIATLSWIFGKRPGIDFEAARHWANIVTIGHGPTPTRAQRPKPAPRPAVSADTAEAGESALLRAPTSLFPTLAKDAPRTVFGCVVDRAGLPLEGARVMFECPFRGTPWSNVADPAAETTSDENGEFSLVLHRADEVRLVVVHARGNTAIDLSLPPAWQIRKIGTMTIDPPTSIEIIVEQLEPPDPSAVIHVAALPKITDSPFGPLPLELTVDPSTGALEPRDEIKRSAASRVGPGTIDRFLLPPGTDALFLWVTSSVADYRPQRVPLRTGRSRYEVAPKATRRVGFSIEESDAGAPSVEDRAMIVASLPESSTVAFLLPQKGHLELPEFFFSNDASVWWDRALPRPLMPTTDGEPRRLRRPQRGTILLANGSTDASFAPLDVEEDDRRRYVEFFGRFDRSRTVGEDGVRLALDPGHWRVTTAENVRETIHEVVIVAGRETTFAGAPGRSTPSAELRGRVVDRSGNGVALAAVAVSNDFRGIPARHVPWIAVSDADGRFIVSGVPDGEMTILIDSPSHAPAHLPVKLTAETTTDLGNIALEDGAAIVVEVKSPVDRPLEGIDVAIIDPLGRCLFSKSDALGHARFPSTAPIEHVAAAYAGRFSLPRDSWSFFQKSAAEQSIVAVVGGRATIRVEEPQRLSLDVAVAGVAPGAEVRLEIVENDRDSRGRVATLFGFDVYRSGTAELSAVFPGKYLAIANVGVETRVVPFEIDRSTPERLTLAFDFLREK